MRMEVKKAAQLSLLGAQARRSALEMVYRATSGHLGGSMSLCEILSVLYFDTMRIDPAKPDDPDRDRFVLSKGHCTPALYSVLAMRGFFPREMLSTFRSIDGHSPVTRKCAMCPVWICPPAVSVRAFPPLWVWRWPVR